MSVLLILLLSLVEVHSQTAPYLTFMNCTIPNHAYVNLSLVGEVGGTVDEESGNEVICHTDLDTCCRGDFGHGEWLFPNGTELPGVYNNPESAIARRRLDLRVRLQRGLSSNIRVIPHGIYQCNIETVAVIDQGGTGREMAYVGLYVFGGIYIFDTQYLCIVIL